MLWVAVSPPPLPGRPGIGHINTTTQISVTLLMKTRIAVICTLVAAAVCPLHLNAQTWAWSATYPPSSNQYATWTDSKGLVVNMDCWGGVGSQTINANSGSNWQVITTQSSSGVASYPHVELNNINQPVTNLSPISSSYNGTSASGTSYDFAYDIWVGTSSLPHQYEIMIWNTWNGTNPIAQSYNANGAVPTYTNVTISGRTYNVYTGTGGSGPYCMSFLPTTQAASATIDITAILQWIYSVGYFSNPTNPNLLGIQCGWEITSTGGVQKTYTMNSYSVTIGSTVHVTGVTVSPGSASVAVGGTTTLTATVSPSNASNKSVTWSSSATGVATVNSSGVVTGVAAGNATVSATTVDGGFRSPSIITVTSGSGTVATTGVSVSPTSASVAVGGTTTLTATVSPSNASNKSVTWSSSNTSVATVNSSGVVTGVAAGNATVTATTVSGGYKASSAITVTTGSTGGTTVTVPFTKDGAGTFTFVTTGPIAYFNSWNMTSLTCNGIDYTNKYVSTMPAKVNGQYTFKYVSSTAYGHLELR